MRVSRFTSIQEPGIVEEVPLDGSDTKGLSGLGVAFTEFISWISDEDASKRCFDILEIPSSSEIREA
jgi:hypothetical protein